MSDAATWAEATVSLTPDAREAIWQLLEPFALQRYEATPEQVRELVAAANRAIHDDIAWITRLKNALLPWRD